METLKETIVYLDNNDRGQIFTENETEIVISKVISTEKLNCYNMIVRNELFQKYSDDQFVLFYGHDEKDILGTVRDIRIEEYKGKECVLANLYIRKSISSNLIEAIKVARFGTSIGFSTLKYEIKEQRYIITDLELHEISLTFYPANHDTKLAARIKQESLPTRENKKYSHETKQKLDQINQLLNRRKYPNARSN